MLNYMTTEDDVVLYIDGNLPTIMADVVIMVKSVHAAIAEKDERDAAVFLSFVKHLLPDLTFADTDDLKMVKEILENNDEHSECIQDKNI